MNMWTLIIAGVLLATLGSALKDAGVFVEKSYGKFEKRVKPETSWMICTKSDGTQWFQLPKFEKILQDFERGKNNRNMTVSLGTPTMLVAMAAAVEFNLYGYCKYAPPPLHENDVYSANTQYLMVGRMPYYAVKVKNTQRATINQGWLDLKNLLKKHFGTLDPENLERVIVEITASGQVYVGVFQIKP